MMQEEEGSRLATSRQMKRKGDGTTDRKTVTWILVLLLLLATCLQSNMSLHAKYKNRVASYRDTISSSTSTTVHHSGLPKVDEILFKAYPGATPDTIVDKFLVGETDWLEGPHRTDLYQQVIDAGHKISPMDPLPEFGFIVINCRDYKETSGEPNFPLNDSRFRVALSYIYGMDDKEDDVYNYARTRYFALGNPVPPAQEPWYDETVQMPNTNWSTAWSILEVAGYHINNTENWLYCNGVKIRNVTLLHGSNCGRWHETAAAAFVRAFNEFITTYLGIDGPTITASMTDFMTLINEVKVYHDFDFACLGLTNQGRYVDWLYDCLHSDNIRDGGWNFGGILDPEFDQWTETIITSLNTTEVIEAASKVQARFVYELMPWIPISNGKQFCTMVRDERGELMNVVSMPNYGPRNDWSWMTIHWKGEPGVAWPGGTLTVALQDEPHTLNPYTEDTSYGWHMLDRAVTGLTMFEPVNLTEMPWVTTDWQISYWTSIPELGIENGSKCTFYLRQDVTWHDGTPVTAYDCVSNMKVMRKYKLGRYRSTWENMVYEEAEGPYKFSVYFDQISLHYPYYVAKTALLAPKHMIEAVEQQVEDGTLDSFFDWDPCFNSYEDLMGEAPPEEYSFMKQVVGCGPFVFDYYDRSLATGRVVKYRDFFVNAPAIGGVVGEWRIEPDTPYPYKVLVQNVAACEDSEEGELVPVTVDVKVYEDEELVHEETDITLDPWDWAYLGPYTTDTLPAGPHTIKVEVYESETLIHTYTHEFVSTLREDVSTYTGDTLDFKVNIMDIARVVKAFGSSVEEVAKGTAAGLRWDPACDIDHSFKVNIQDIVSIAKRFGWTA